MYARGTQEEPRMITDEMTLTEAAARLRRSYVQVLRLVLIGEIEGRQELGRWRVRRSSVELLAAREGDEDAESIRRRA